MDREVKYSIRILVVKIMMLVAVFLLSFFLYAFVYRGKTEPPKKYHMTNRNAAVYTLKGQMQMLSKKENLVDFAFEDRKDEKEYGTYVIPGLKFTKTLLTEAGTSPDICTSMTPQGLAITEKYVLISAYCHTEKHNSVIYMIDKEEHKFIKEIILPGKPHAGGLAYDQEHGVLWYASNTNGIAQAISISMAELESYDFENGHRPIVTRQVCSLYGIIRDSFMTFYEDCLYVGCFMKYTESVIARYEIDEEGYLVTTMDEELGMDFAMSVPLDYSTISEQAQGMAFYKNKLLLSHSFGILPSRLIFYEQSDERLYVNENSAKSYVFPERMEQICVEGDERYVLFESAAYAYQASSINIVDRVLKLNLLKMEECENDNSYRREIRG